MANHSLTGYGSPGSRLCFDGDDTKYEQWEVKLLAYMKIIGLKDVISPDSTTISSQDDREKCFAQLVQFLDDRSLSLVMRDARDDGRKAMKILRQHYTGAGQPRIISLWNALSSLQKQQTEDLTGYILRAETAASAIKNAGENVSDSLLIAMVMNGLPPAYKPFVVYTTQSDKVLTFSAFKTAIRNFHENEAASIARRVKNELSDQFDGVMSLQHRQNERRDNNNKSTHVVRNGSGGGQNNNPPKQQQAAQSSMITCFTCKGFGHKFDVCPTSLQNNNQNPREQGRTDGRKWCSTCKTNSHTDKMCRKQTRRNGGGGDDARFLQHDDSYEPRDNNPNNHSFVMHVYDTPVCDSQGQQPTASDTFLVDSGATSHIVKDISKFISFADDFRADKHSMTLANGKKEQVAENSGTVLISIRTETGQIVDVHLERTLYIPSYPQDIFAVKAVTKKGGSVLLRSDDGVITKDDTNFPIRTSDGELYYLDLYDKSSVVKDAAKSCHPSAVRSSSLEQWHHILGHVNKRDILKLEQVVEDMKISSKKDFPCDTCTLSKQSVHVSRQPDERATAPLQFIHSDLAGPIEPVAKDGLKYVINFVDDFTGASFVYFLRCKSDATKALEKFLCDIAPYGKVEYVITRLRSDNGGEYVSKAFEEVLLKHTIRHEFSSPHSPHQNGTAERNWRTLFEMARGMMIESGISRNLWSYAVMAAAHIRNRMYCSRIDDTPYHMLTGKKPSISKLHLFGSVCFAYTQQKKKLDPRCTEGLFVGYDKYSPAYLVYFPDTNTIGKFGTVSFTERYGASKSDKSSQPQLASDEDDIPFNTVISFYNQQSQTQYSDAIQPAQYETNLLPTMDAEFNEMIADENYETPLLRNTFKESEPVTNEETHRYPQRTRQRPQHYTDSPSTHGNAMGMRSHTDFANCIRDSCHRISETPPSYSRAVTDKDADQWQLAMESEMSSMKDNDVFEVVPLPKGKKVVGSRWVFSIKDNPDGAVIHKARFVAKGFSQVEGSDYTDTYSPTAKMETVRMLMQFAIENDMVVQQLDVKTAYLNAPIDCEVYVKQPQGFEVQPRENSAVLVWKLKKSLYGLKQSGRNWNIVLSHFFNSKGFTQSKVDPCLFVRLDNSGKVYIVVWVDDIIVAGTTEIVTQIKDILKTRFKMTDLGNISYFLGIEFHQSAGQITMSQSHYLKGVLKRYNMENCKPRSTPSEANLDVYASESDDSVHSPSPEDVTRYREIVGSLVYAMTCSRPDLTWIITKLSQHLACPTQADWMIITHVLRYIKGTLNQKLTFRKSQNGPLQLLGHSDSDWASSKDDRKSITGYCFTLNPAGPIIAWKSRKQPTVALSSCEAEYMALTNATQEAMFLLYLTRDFGQKSRLPIMIMGDNQGSLDMVRNDISNDRSKHIDIKHHYIRDKHREGLIDTKHVSTNNNIADLFTKPATKLKLVAFTEKLFGYSS